ARSPGPSGLGLRRRSRSTIPEISASLALPTLQPLSDYHADGDERRHPDEPGDEALRNRADVADRPAAAVIRVLRVLDVADDRVELAIGDVLLREGRHHVGADPDGLCDLRRRRVLERRRERPGD